MRHRKFGWRLSRDTNARKALLRNLASSLLVNGKITTTQAKAKFARGYVEKMVTAAVKSGLAARRRIASSLTGEAFKKLVDQIGPGFASRPGGYTRIIKLEQRAGDAAPMARLEFVQMEKVEPKPIKSTLPKTKNNQQKSVKKSAKSAQSK